MFFSLSSLGSMRAEGKDRHYDPVELEYLGGVFGLPKPMDLHYLDL